MEGGGKKTFRFWRARAFFHPEPEVPLNVISNGFFFSLLLQHGETFINIWQVSLQRNDFEIECAFSRPRRLRCVRERKFLN